jgi:WD40 repeat protein
MTVAFSSDGRRAVVADLHRSVPSPDGRGFFGRWSAAVFDVRSGQELFHLLDTPVPPPAGAQTQRFVDAAFSPDEGRLAVLGRTNADYRVQVFDCQTQQPRVAFPRPTAGGMVDSTIAFCAGGDRLALGIMTREWLRCVELCDAATGQSTLLVEDVGALPALTRNGRLLATVARRTNRIQLWDTASGRPLAVLHDRAQGESIVAVAFSVNGDRLAAVGPQCVVIYETASRKEALRFQPGIDCTVVAFSTDGKRLATGGETGVVTLWDAQSGQEVLTLRGHGGAIVRLAFSADGRFLGSSSKDGSVKLWEAAPPLPEKASDP